MVLTRKFLNSTQSRDEQLQVQMRCQRGEIKLLYIAPERLMMEVFFTPFSAMAT